MHSWLLPQVPNALVHIEAAIVTVEGLPGGEARSYRLSSLSGARIETKEKSKGGAKAPKGGGAVLSIEWTPGGDASQGVGPKAIRIALDDASFSRMKDRGALNKLSGLKGGATAVTDKSGVTAVTDKENAYENAPKRVTDKMKPASH